MTTGDDNVTLRLAGRWALPDPARVWFVSSAPRPHAAVALFCLPYAGAGPSVFHQWPRLLGPDVDVAAVALPGREGRIAEPPDWDVTELADAVTARAGGRRYALYGHSMGAKVAVEIVRVLRRRGDPLPMLVAIGGSRAPHRPHPLDGLSHASDSELLRRLWEVGGVPALVIEEPELRELVLPAIRADFHWLDAFTDVPGAPLPVPVRAFAGVDDSLATPVEMLHWLPRAGAGFRLRTLPGGHFFLASEANRLAAALRAELAATVGSAPPSDAGLPSGAGLAAAPPDEDEVHVWYARLDEQVTSSALLHRVSAAYRIRSSTTDLRFAAAHAGGVGLVAVARGQDVAVGVEVAADIEPADTGLPADIGQPAMGFDGTAAAPEGGWQITRLPLPGAVGVVAQRRTSWRLCLEEVGPGHALAGPSGGCLR